MTVEILTGGPVPPPEARETRNVWPAMLRGMRGRCPHCGKGSLYASYLKVAPACSECSEEFHHHRADDAPPYLTIFAVGHLIVPPLMWLELAYEPAMWVHFALWIPLTLVLSLVLLPPIKGAVIALQWALRMHGFDPDSADAREDAALVAAQRARST